jgi:hypothetical protein
LRQVVCTLSADAAEDAEQVGCWIGGVTTKAGDAGEVNHDYSSRTSCSWSLYAHSSGWWDASAWIGVQTVLRQRIRRRVAGPEYSGEKIVDQNTPSTTFDYSAEVPPEAKLTDGSWQSEVRIVDNTGREYVLTDQTMIIPGVAAAAIAQDGPNAGRVTVTLAPTFKQR